MLNSGLEVSEFDLKSRYYVHFRTLGKGMKPLIPLTMGLVLSLLSFYRDVFGIKFTHEGWYVIKQRNQTKPKRILLHVIYYQTLQYQNIIIKNKILTPI